MKQIIIDIIGLIGFGGFAYALHSVDPRVAFGICGAMLMIFSALASKNNTGNKP